MGELKRYWTEAMCLTAEEEERMPMGKTAEAKIEVEERRKEMQATVRAYRASTVEGIDLGRLAIGSVDACFIVAMLGPKLDAIEERLDCMEDRLVGALKQYAGGDFT